MTDMQGITLQRAKIVELAEKSCGSGATVRRDEFVEVLGPGNWDIDRPFGAKLVNGKWKTQGISTCGLVAEGLWRLAGVSLPDGWWPYRPKTATEYAISRAQVFALKQGALQRPMPGCLPSPGDYICIGSGMSTHACTMIEWQGDDDIVTCDGGQVDASGLQCIKRCVRPWREFFVGARAVNWWICVDLLPWQW